MTRATIRLLTSCIAAVLIAGCTANPSEVQNDPQPLRLGTTEAASYEIEAWSRGVSHWTTEDPITSFGVDTCLSGVAEVELVKIEPVETVGSVKVLDALLMSSTNAEDRIAFFTGSPPQSADDAATFVPFEGATFDSVCGNDDRTLQILVAFEASGLEGGGWKGARITYNADGETYQLVAPVEMLMCGEATKPCPGT